MGNPTSPSSHQLSWPHIFSQSSTTAICNSLVVTATDDSIFPRHYHSSIHSVTVPLQLAQQGRALAFRQSGRHSRPQTWIAGWSICAGTYRVAAVARLFFKRFCAALALQIRRTRDKRNVSHDMAWNCARVKGKYKKIIFQLAAGKSRRQPDFELLLVANHI